MITITEASPTRVTAGRMLAFAVALLIAGGAMTGSLAELINSPNTQAAPVLHVATVLATPAPTATEVSVQFTPGGTAHRFPYHHPYVPVTGDHVTVLLLGGSGATLSGIVLGGRSGQSGNLVVNGGFADARQFPLPATSSLLPYHWSQHTASGQTAILAGQYRSKYQRKQLLFAINNGTAGDNYAVSAAFPVRAGETLYVDSLWDYIIFEPSPTTVTVQLRVAWFASAAGTYPGFLSETQIATYSDSLDGAQWQGGSTAVPAGVTFARVAVRISQSGGNLNYTAAISEVSARRQL